MKIFLAGATGAVGRPLLPLLVEAGHEVAGTTRSEAKADQIRAAGGEPVVVNALDAEALRKAVVAAEPEVVINQLTALPDALDFRDKNALAATNRLRGEAGPSLAKIAADVGAKRLIAQSVSFFYAPIGGPVKTEDDPMLELPPGSTEADGAMALRELELSTLERPGVAGLVLRYGFFYGPGTYYGEGGSTTEAVSKRRFPVVGKGSGMFSFIHTDDAAAATLAAVERGGPGIYNVTDDEPAPMSEWLPVFAESIGAKPPRRVPAWLARMAAGKQAVGLATGLRGASNSKAKRELDWSPSYESWRRGFSEAPR
jgi:nucleoside-diphosphate-sugar epimerase